MVNPAAGGECGGQAPPCPPGSGMRPPPVTNLLRRNGVVLGYAAALLATAVAAVALVGENHSAYDLYNFDPQGNDQQLAYLHATAAYLYTSGQSVGQLAAMLFGAALATARASRSARTTVAIAAAGGAGLAMVNAATAVPRAARLVPELGLIVDVNRQGVPFEPALSHQPEVAAALVVGLLGFPLWAVIGAGVGALVGRWWPVAGFGWYGASFLLMCVPAVGFSSDATAESPAAATVRFLLLLAVPQYNTIAATTMVAVPTGGAPVAAAVPLGLLLYAVLSCRVGFARAARRARTPDPA